MNLRWRRWLNYFSQVSLQKIQSRGERDDPLGPEGETRKFFKRTPWKSGVDKTQGRCCHGSQGEDKLMERATSSCWSLDLVMEELQCPSLFSCRAAGYNLLNEWSLQIFFSRGLGQGLPTGKPQRLQSSCMLSLKYFCTPALLVLLLILLKSQKNYWKSYLN